MGVDPPTHELVKYTVRAEMPMLKSARTGKIETAADPCFESFVIGEKPRNMLVFRAEDPK